MRGGDNTEPGAVSSPVSGAVSSPGTQVGSVLTVMLFIGETVQSSNRIELKEHYTAKNIKSMSLNTLRSLLNTHGYYKYKTLQEYFILKELIDLKEKNINELQKY